MPKILIADDEELLVRLVSDFLKNNGYETAAAYDGDTAFEIVQTDPEISLAVVDIMMPGLNGWELTRKIRKITDIPVIMLSARAEDFDQIAGFEAGIDEYVTKPFSPAVLVKRVEALLKRSTTQKKTVSPGHGLVLEREAYTAYLEGTPLSLTIREFELLCYLETNHGLVLSRDQILDGVWGYDYNGDSRTVDSHVARLRTKLGDWGALHLKTVYGVGYKFEIDTE